MAIEQKRGHWITTKLINNGIYHLSSFYRFSHKCSNCNFEIVNPIRYIDVSYCPSCKAKMDEVLENEG